MKKLKIFLKSRRLCDSNLALLMLAALDTLALEFTEVAKCESRLDTLKYEKR